MPDEKLAAVFGVGPGLGASVARRFAREGYAVALMARDVDHVEPVKDQIEAAGRTAFSIPTDATDPASVTAAFTTMRGAHSDPEVLVYNAGAFKMGGVLEVTPDEFEQCWRANCLGGFLMAREGLPAMVERGRGTILLTGATASLRGGARFSCLAVGKFGLRALAQSLAREFGPQGIHVAHIIIDGQINLKRTREAQPDRGDETFLAPDAIAESYWHLHTQDPTTWTLELDLRPAVEKF